MELSNRTKIIGAVVALAFVFALGRYTTPVKVVTEVKTVEVEKKVTDANKDSQISKHQKTVTTTLKKPDGTVETTTTTTDDTQQNTEASTSITDDTTTKTDTTKEVVRGSSPMTISALAGLSISNFGNPVYGASVTKPVLGPIAVGAWGLSNGTAGVSLGLQF